MPYQSTPQDRTLAYIIGAVYVALAIALAIMLFKIWPPIPWPLDSDEDKERLAAIVADIGCTPETSTAISNGKDNQAASPTPAGKAGQTASPSPSPTATQSASPSPAGTQAAVRAASQPTASSQTPTPVATPTPSASASATPRTNPKTGELEIIPMKLFGQCVQTTFDERLLLLVIVVGMLGAFVHGATSLADYLGNNAFNRNWSWFYLLRPAIGMALALVFYFAIRGGFLSTTGGAKDINPYGIAALAGMVGMFSKQATDKLGEIFSTLFRSGGDDRRADSLDGSRVAALKLDPPSVAAGSDAFTLTVNGTGFVDGATVNINDNPQPTTFVSATQLTAQVAKETIANAGTLKLTVVNKDQTKIGPVDLVVSAAGSSGSTSATTGATTSTSDTPEQPVTGEGGDADLIDGCDVDMKADTPDEDLPITEGGVK